MKDLCRAIQVQCEALKRRTLEVRRSLALASSNFRVLTRTFARVSESHVDDDHSIDSELIESRTTSVTSDSQSLTCASQVVHLP